MNNRNLNNLINLYGGNDNINDYTSSLLEKYKNTNKSNIIKINNLESMLADTDSDNDSDSIFKMNGGSNNIIKINNLEKILNYTETETNNFEKNLMKKSKKKKIRILSEMII